MADDTAALYERMAQLARGGLKIYLAGAIRDGNEYDVDWRERMIDALGDRARFINPLAGKTYDRATKAWSMSGEVPTAPAIVAHDFWALEHCDAVVFNFKALSEGYANIGTLVEFGFACSLGRRILRYVVIDADFKGHDNQAMYRLHPFLEQNAAMIFHTTDACISFLKGHLGVLGGHDPHFGGYQN
jgi:nucleoside 2-deoxyribosyltransferase